jgi:Leucine-rich repeat (LRR) protein
LISIFLLVALADSISALDVHCQLQRNYWTSHGPLEECIVYDLTVDSPDTNITSLEFSRRWINHNEIQSFYVYQSPDFEYFPKGVENYFVNVKVLVVAYTGLKVLTQEDLKPLTKLRDLYVDNNQLEVIESDLFEFNTDIEVMNFSNNRIKTVGVNAFAPLKSIEHLNMQNNDCINKKGTNKKEIDDLLYAVSFVCGSFDDIEAEAKFEEV